MATFISTYDLGELIGVDLSQDVGATIAVEAASEMCRTIAEQPFDLVAGDIVTLDGTGTDAILLPKLPVATAGTVTVNGTIITDYVLDTTRGMLLRGTTGSYPRPVWPSGRQNVVVTYTHGYGTIPADVRMVALEVARRIVIQGAATEETVGDVRIKYAGAATDMTDGELRILRKYRQIR